MCGVVHFMEIDLTSQLMTIIVYIEADSQKRLGLHKTLQNAGKYSASLYLPTFECYSGLRLYKCPYCNNKLPVTSKHYRYGMNDNNIDESYSWICDKCDEMVRWEPNFDGFDELITVNRRNAVCTGDYFRSHRPHWTDETATDLAHYRTYEIPDPPSNLSKEALGQYLSKQIEMMEAGRPV